MPFHNKEDTDFKTLTSHLSSNVKNLIEITNSFYFDFLAVSETWTEESDHNDFSINGYIQYFCSRKNMRGGGVALYINESLEHKYLSEISLCIENCIEMVFVEIVQLNGRNIII